MSGLWGLGGNVASGALLFVLGLASRRIFARLRGVRVGRFWRRLVDGEITLVIGRFDRADFLEYEPSGVVGIGDIRALHELIDILLRAGMSNFKIAYADTLSEQQLCGNLVLLGGSDTNATAAGLMRDVGARVEFLSEG